MYRVSTRHIVLIVGLATAMATPAAAQETTGAIIGTVTSEDGVALPGVTLELTDGETGLQRTALSAADGGYKLVALPPARYELIASLTGFQTAKRAIRVELGRTVTNDVELSLGAVTETIEVTGEAPQVDVTSNVSGLTVNTDRLTSQVPLARDVTQVALLAPGTMEGDSAFNRVERGTTPGQTLNSIGGASVAENVYQVNGLNITNFRNGLGSTFVPMEFVQELQVKTGGYEAEYGRATGGVVNMVTKSGTNSFHGSASVYFRPESLQEQERNTYDRFNQDETVEEAEFNASIGGPVVKDHLFFFAFLRHWQSDRLGLLSNTGTLFENSQPYWGGKVDWNITPNHRLEGTYIDDSVDTDTSFYYYDPIAGLEPAGLTGKLFRGGSNSIAKYTGILSSNFLVSAQFGRNDFDRTTESDGDRCPVARDSRGGTTTYLGCWVNTFRGSSLDEREAARIDVDWYRGNHSLRAGLDAEANVSNDNEEFSGGIYYRYYDASEPTDEYPYVVRVWRAENVGSWDVNSRAAYVQDSWAVASNITLNLGLRYEEFENKNALGETFIEVTDQWAPRLGVIWDSSGQGRSKLYGSFGLYYLPIPSTANVSYATGAYQDIAFFQWTGDHEPDGSPTGFTDCGRFELDECGSQGSVGDFIPPYMILEDGTVGDPRELISTNFDPMSQWELILGYEQMVGANWSLGARFVARQFNEIIEDFAIAQALWEEYGIERYNPDEYRPDFFRLGNPGSDFVGWVDLEGNGELTQMRITAEELGHPEASRNYYAVELMFKRRFSANWMLEGSYTWSHLYGNYEGMVLSDLGQDSAGLTETFDFRATMENSSGNLAQDRRHNLKLFGAYTWDFGLQIGANAGWRTGRPINSFGVHPTDPYSQQGWWSFYTLGEPAPRGTFGTTDDVTWLDLMFKYDFVLGVDWFVRLDIFNLFNWSAVTEVNEFAEQTTSSPPNYVLDPYYGEPEYYQSPRSVRFGFGVSF